MKLTLNHVEPLSLCVGQPSIKPFQHSSWTVSLFCNWWNWGELTIGQFHISSRMISTPKHRFTGLIKLCLASKSSTILMVLRDHQTVCPWIFPGFSQTFYKHVFLAFPRIFHIFLMIFQWFSYVFSPPIFPMIFPPNGPHRLNHAANVAGASKSTASSTACVGKPNSQGNCRSEWDSLRI